MVARKTTKKLTKNVRLTNDILPLKYTLHFEPDLENFVFLGEEEITLDVKKPTKTIRLHAAELKILSVELIQAKTTLVGETVYNEDDEEIEFVFKHAIKKGKATLKVSFTGILNDKMRGFYRSKYLHNGKEYHMGVTQFESTDARRAFPCFDEPSKKAVFQVSLKIPEDRVAISNMLEETVMEHKGGFKIIKFSESPKMSSYLLAFIIGHFEYIESKTNDGVVVRVFVTPGKKKQAEFSLGVAVKSLEFYTTYFGIKYPLPTMDLVAIPDFAAGAMENWGAVTYRETALLVDPENSSTHNKQWVALVIAHELAHQWFGNLVTMEWWTHLWLNEGFASYMEYVAVDKMFPEWNIWTQFVYMDHGHALELDGLKNTHAIEVDVHHPAEISEIFDEVSYSKGASVIRMLAEYLGEKNFRDGLRSYLKKHSYANASTTDLWKSLEQVSKKPVSKMMHDWTGKAGYPLVSVEKNKGKLTFSQQRFFSSVSSQKTKDTTTWMIPLHITSGKTKTAKQLLLDRKKILTPYDTSWVKVNKNETSFIRVKYDASLLSQLTAPLLEQDPRLSEEDRFGIVRDAFVLSEAGYASADAALGLSVAYRADESYIVWADLAGELGKIKNLLYGEKIYDSYKNFIVSLFSEIGRKVGWEKKKDEKYSITLLRSMILGVLGRNGDIETLAKALSLYDLDQKGKVALDPDLKGMVYALVCENGGEKEYAHFLSLYKKETFQEEKDRLLRALCMFQDEKLLQKALDFAFTSDVKAQDAFKVISYVSANPYGRDLAWKKTQDEWGNIVKKFSGGHLYTRFVKPLANFVDEKDAKEIEAFFKTHESKGLERTISQVLEQIRSNAAWLKRDKEKIESFLASSPNHFL